MNHLERRIRMEALKRQRNEIQREMYTLEESCPHTYERVHDSAECVGCGRHGGWWCPDSPDHLCSYNWEENGESCIHCGNPDERK